MGLQHGVSGPSQNYIYSTLAEDSLNEINLDYKVRVISAGVGAYLSTHERILVLNKIQNLAPDILIMFSGWNDTYAGYRGKRVNDDTWDHLNVAELLAENNNRYYNEQDEVNQGLDVPQYKDYTIKIFYLIKQVLFKLKGFDQIEKSITDSQIEPNIVLRDLKENINAVLDASIRKNFVLIFYLQPTLYNTNKNLTNCESLLADEGEKTSVAFPAYNKKIYDLYRKELPKMANEQGFIYVDGDDAIKNKAKTVFDDHVHFGDRGNRYIANDIVKLITDLIYTNSSANKVNRSFIKYDKVMKCLDKNNRSN